MLSLCCVLFYVQRGIKVTLHILIACLISQAEGAHGPTQRADTHARTHARAANKSTAKKNACACLAYVTTLVTISAEAKGIYKPGQRVAGAAGSEPVHRLDQSDRISCTDSVKPLRALGANSTSCVCMVWVGVRAAGLLARGGDEQSTRG